MTDSRKQSKVREAESDEKQLKVREAEAESDVLVTDSVKRKATPIAKCRKSSVWIRDRIAEDKYFLVWAECSMPGEVWRFEQLGKSSESMAARLLRDSQAKVDESRTRLEKTSVGSAKVCWP